MWCQFTLKPRFYLSALITNSICNGKFHHAIIVKKINKKSVIVSHIACPDYLMKVPRHLLDGLL
jgi:hypothetical protein